jgi:hypothetical protein
MLIMDQFHLATSQEVCPVEDIMTAAKYMLMWLLFRYFIGYCWPHRVVWWRAVSCSAHPCHMFGRLWMETMFQLHLATSHEVRFAQYIIACATFFGCFIRYF